MVFAAAFSGRRLGINWFLLAPLRMNTCTSAELWCICQKPEAGRFMIQCDVQEPDFKIWYHALLIVLVL